MSASLKFAALSMAVVVFALATATVSAAECVTITLKKGERFKGPTWEPALIFTGTVTAMDQAQHTLSIDVDRVWKGELHRHTTLFVVPVVEGNGVTYFKTGDSYLFELDKPLDVSTAEEVAFGGVGTMPVGTLSIILGCNAPAPLTEASQSLKKLGRGRPPLP